MSAPKKKNGRISAAKERHLTKAPRRNSRQQPNREQLLRGSRSAVVEQQRERDRSARLRAPVEHTPPERRARLLAVLREMRGNDAHTQAQRVLRALRGGPCTTVELRKWLDVMAPAARVFALRAEGHAIETFYVAQQTDAGRLHRVGMYRLRR